MLPRGSFTIGLLQQTPVASVHRGGTFLRIPNGKRWWTTWEAGRLPVVNSNRLRRCGMATLQAVDSMHSKRVTGCGTEVVHSRTLPCMPGGGQALPWTRQMVHLAMSRRTLQKSCRVCLGKRAAEWPSVVFKTDLRFPRIKAACSRLFLLLEVPRCHRSCAAFSGTPECIRPIGQLPGWTVQIPASSRLGLTCGCGSVHRR